MRKIKYKKGRKLHPYNLEYTGVHKSNESEMQLFVYDDLNLIEYEDFRISDLDKFINTKETNWLNIHGLNNIAFLQAIAGYFDIDNFMLADILNTTRRTKLEESQDCLFFNIKSGFKPRLHGQHCEACQVPDRSSKALCLLHR